MADITRDIFDPIKAVTKLLFQKRRPVLDAEVNVIQDNIAYDLKFLTVQLQPGSGAVDPGTFSPFIGSTEDRTIQNNTGLFLADGIFHFVAGSDNTATPVYNINMNKIRLNAPPATGVRTDFVWLEMWVEEIDQHGVFYKYGNLLGGTVPNDIVDPGVGFPTTLRMVKRFEIRFADDSSSFASSGVLSKDGYPFNVVLDRPNLYADRAQTDPGVRRYAVALATVERSAGQTVIDTADITNMFVEVGLGSGGMSPHAPTHSAGGTDPIDIKHLADSDNRLPSVNQAGALPGAGGMLYPPSNVNPYVTKDFADANYTSATVDVRPMHVDELLMRTDAILANRDAKFVVTEEDSTLPNAVLLANAYHVVDHIVTAGEEVSGIIVLSGSSLPFPDAGKSVNVYLGLVRLQHTNSFIVTDVDTLTFTPGLLKENDALQIVWPKIN